MSPLPNSVVRGAQALRQIAHRWDAASRFGAGIAFGSRAVSAVCLDPPGTEGRIRHSGVESVGLNLFRDEPTATVRAALEEALRRLIDNAGLTELPVQVALPDPAAVLTRLEFDKLPATRRALDALVRWRMGREYYLEPGSYEFSFQRGGQHNGRELLWVCGLDRTWLDTIHMALAAVGVYAPVIDTDLSYRFNLHHDTLTASGKGGALITATDAYWTLLVWDQDGRPYFVRSAWASPNDGAQSRSFADLGAWAHSIALTVHQLVTACAANGPEMEIGALHVAAAAPLAQALAAALDPRMTQPCTVLPASGPWNISVTSTSPLGEVAEAALGAAFRR